MNKLNGIAEEQINKNLPGFKSGDRVSVDIAVREGEKERIQSFVGDVIRIRKAGRSSSFTVRKISYGIGVERIFPLHSPLIKKIKVIRKGAVRRSRLFYLRKLRGKAARIKEHGRRR